MVHQLPGSSLQSSSVTAHLVAISVDLNRLPPQQALLAVRRFSRSRELDRMVFYRHILRWLFARQNAARAARLRKRAAALTASVLLATTASI